MKTIKKVSLFVFLIPLAISGLFGESNAAPAKKEAPLSYEELSSRFERLKAASKAMVVRYRALEKQCTLQAEQPKEAQQGDAEIVRLRREIVRLSGELEKKSRQLRAQQSALAVVAQPVAPMQPVQVQEPVSPDAENTDLQIQNLLQQLIEKRQTREPAGKAAKAQAPAVGKPLVRR
jgi:hypothetical protein